MGVREEEADKITITPALPQALRHVGATYRIAPIPWSTNVFGIECTVRDSKGYTVRVLCERRKMEKAAEGVEKGELPPNIVCENINQNYFCERIASCQISLPVCKGRSVW
jgi:hypothetical protein